MEKTRCGDIVLKEARNDESFSGGRETLFNMWRLASEFRL